VSERLFRIEMTQGEDATPTYTGDLETVSDVVGLDAFVTRSFYTSKYNPLYIRHQKQMILVI
jgi:hypothetical protein